jgi:hypothetical protein
MGGGIVCYDAGAKLMHNRIINNSVSNPSNSGGGGIAFMPATTGYWIVIRNNVISGNSALTINDNPYGGGIYTGGDARIESNVIEGNYVYVESSAGTIHGGGGVYAESLSSNPIDTIILVDNLIQNNIIEGGDEAWGAGICCGDLFSCPVAWITNNTIINNSIVNSDKGWGTGIYLDEIRGEVVIRDNQIQFNSATCASACGTVIWINQPVAEISINNNVISYNWATSGINYAWAAGIWLWEAENVQVTIDGNIISNNEGNRAGGFYARNSNNFHLVNNVIANNVMTNSGGAVQMFQYYGSDNSIFQEEGGMKIAKNPGRTKTGSPHPVIANNTFAYNDGGQYGGAIYIETYDSLCPVIFNNIFWENEAANGKDIYFGGSSPLFIENNLLDTNLISGSWEGDGNFYEDPGFTDDSLHINNSSPCFDQGADSVQWTDAWYYAPDHDYEGSPRPYNEGIDIGADEWDISAVEELKTQYSTLNIHIYPNPTCDISYFAFHISQYQYVSLKIYDVHGREVAMAVNEVMPPGEYAASFDTNQLFPGIYFCRLTAGNQSSTGKLVVAR